MPTPPPEILIAIINELTADTLLSAYTISSEAKAALRNLALVNYACYELSVGPLYRRVTVKDDQIASLRATLSSTTPRARSLASRIQALRLTTSDDHPRDSAKADKGAAEAASLLHLLAPPNASLKRLFMDMFLTSTSLHRPQPPDGVFSLQETIGVQTSLTELVLGNLEEWSNNFFWTIEIAKSQYDCFARLRSLTILDMNVVYPPTQVVLAQIAEVEELVLVRPWISMLGKGGEVLAELFAPNRALKSLIIVLASGWETMPTQELKMEDLGAAMIPHRDKTLILPKDGGRNSLPPWETVRDKIGTGHRVLFNETRYAVVCNGGALV